MNDWEIKQGHVLDLLAAMEPESVQTVCTSPPYYSLRDYGIPASQWPAIEYAPMAGMPPVSIPAMECCLGLEPSLDAFIGHTVEVFRGVWRVLRNDGTCWVNFGDSYTGGGSHNNAGFNERYFGKEYASDKQAVTDKHKPARSTVSGGLKPKDLMMVPARIALALQSDGWYLRSDIIWAKRAPMPESVTDRPTSAHEHIYLLSKQGAYYYDSDSVRERVGEVTRRAATFRNGGVYTGNQSFHNGTTADKDSHGDGHDSTGRNMWNYWLLSPEPCPEAHFATFPSEIPRRAILAGSKAGDMVLDPFSGSGTTVKVALRLGRRGLGLEINPEYVAMSERIIRDDCPMFNSTTLEEQPA